MQDTVMASPQEQKDLGFGSVLAQQSRVRLMNRDGSFNVQRGGKALTALLSPYQSLLTMSWGRFLLVITVQYVAVNLLFALLYVLCGAQGVKEADGHAVGSKFLESFFLSVQTFGTIGFGNLYPASTSANFVVVLESFASLVAFALITGLIFARFSRPLPRILFSRHAVVTSYRGITGFMFRIANARANEIVGVEATVVYARFATVNGVRTRVFDQLPLERQRVIFFSLSWTIVHPIDEASPLYGVTAEELCATEAEFLVLLTGTDDIFSQTVHTRSSYTCSEVLWGARFTNIFLPPTDAGLVRIDLKRLNDTEPDPVQPSARKNVARDGAPAGVLSD